MSFDMSSRDVVTSSLASALPILKLDSPEAFTSVFQSSVKVTEPSYLTYDKLVIAFDATSKLFEQFPVDNRNVNSLIKSIFVEDGMLIKAPSVASVDGKLYGIGGRHRIAAIGRYFTFLIREQYADDKAVGVALASNQLIRVDIVEVDSTDTLLRLVEADNQSRVMRKPELQHLELQKLGGASFGTDDIAEVILSSDLTPQQAKRLSGQFFSRRNHPKLKTVTRNSIGEIVGCWVLYKVLPKEVRKLSRDAKPRVDAERFNELMDDGWEILCSIIESETILGRNANTLAELVIEKLNSQISNRSRRQRSQTSEPEVMF